MRAQSAYYLTQFHDFTKKCGINLKMSPPILTTPVLPHMFNSQTMKNNRLTAAHAAPLKDGVSDGTTDFSTNRHRYLHAYGVPSNAIVGATSGYAHSLNGQTRVHQNGSTIPQKRWGNTARDASSVTARRRVQQIGLGTMNAADQTMGYSSNVERNTQHSALRRVRGGGSVVPPKVTGTARMWW
jgi:hypothetical protein